MLTVHSLWNIGAQEGKKTKTKLGMRGFCLLVFVGFCCCGVFLVTGSFLNKLMGQQANPVYQGHIT